MKRREFVALLGSVAAIWPARTIAQQGTVRTIGILHPQTQEAEFFLREFRAGLENLGYSEGQNIRFEIRSAASIDRMPALAAELAGLKVDIIVPFQTPAITAAKQATGEIPIVMPVSGDAIATGLIASLARPGGNITGITNFTGDLSAKNLELIRESIPAVRKVAVLTNVPDPFHKTFLDHLLRGGQTLRLEVKPFPVNAMNELAGAFSAMTAAGVEAVVVQPSLRLDAVAEFALKHRMPSFAPNQRYPEAGGLMSYSADNTSLYREAATFVDKILKGRKPADLPVQLPTKYRLNVNLKTAAAIGVTVPATLLVRADEVIE